MTLWQWQTQNDLPYLTCSLLDRWTHGFLTRQFSPRSPFDLTALFAPDAKGLRAKQVHGNRIITPEDFDREANLAAERYPEADGLWVSEPKTMVWVASADCTPVSIGDVETGAVAAVHAGWRGTAAGITVEAIARFQQQGSALKHLRVAMGPAISGEVYQVDESVARKTTAKLDVPFEDWDSHPASPILPDPSPGKVRLDVRQVNQLQLLQLGLSPEQIAIAPHCTYREPERFFSYRRDGTKTVQWSGIACL